MVDIDKEMITVLLVDSGEDLKTIPVDVIRDQSQKRASSGEEKLHYEMQDHLWEEE